jgi:RNA polymerase sigma factor (sigma-70 family)
MLTGDRSVAEDAVQDACLQVLRRGVAGLANPDAYLRAVVVNTCRRRARGSGRMVPFNSTVHDSGVMDAYDIDTIDALRKLSLRRRTAVVLRYFEGRSVLEIAEIMHCAPSTVSSLLHRANQELRELLDD